MGILHNGCGIGEFRRRPINHQNRWLFSNCHPTPGVGWGMIFERPGCPPWIKSAGKLLRTVL